MMILLDIAMLVGVMKAVTSLLEVYQIEIYLETGR